jgi:8-oxo-dGTP diphosphatase
MSYTYRHPHPAVTTNVVIFTLLDEQLRLLLIKRPREPFVGYWALPGGFIDLDEDLEASAMRALERETGITGVYLEQLYTFGRPNRDPRERVITVAYYALVPSDRVRLREDDSVGWFPVGGMPTLALDHEEIVQRAMERLSAKVDYSTIAFQFMPEEFTLSELQGVYETILRERLDKRNFRKWVLGLKHIEETGGERRDGSHRPARLYRARHPRRVEFIR